MFNIFLSVKNKIKKVLKIIYSNKELFILGIFIALLTPLILYSFIEEKPNNNINSNNKIINKTINSDSNDNDLENAIIIYHIIKLSNSGM